jgi:predicted deacetylase
MTETLNRADLEKADMYAASVDRHTEGLREAARTEWIRYHEGQAERLETTAAALASEHRARARKLAKGSV